MSVASAFANVVKILFLLLLILAITFGGVYWFDVLGIVDYKRLIQPFEKRLPSFLRRGEEITEDQWLLDKEFIRKQEQILADQRGAIARENAELEQRALELKEREIRLGEEEKRLLEEKKVLSEQKSAYDNYNVNVKKQAQYFTSMQPQKAVDRLSQLDDLLAIDILRQIDRTAEEQGKISIVPYLLSLMDPAKAASIQRKMTRGGGREEW